MGARLEASGAVRKVRFGVELPQHLGFGTMRDLAMAAEELGFDSVWVRDHLIVSPHEMAQFQQGYLGRNRERSVSGDYLACVPALAAIAAVTRRVVIGTDILNIPRRHPVDVANEIAAVDQISGGRVILQGAIGHPSRDWTPLGRTESLAQRGQMLEESLALIRQLWTADEPIDADGRYFSVRAARIGNRPVQQHLPIWLGVSKTFRRVARYADGFTTMGSMFGGGASDFAEAVHAVRSGAVGFGRNPDDIEPAARLAVVVDQNADRAARRARSGWGTLWRADQKWFTDQAGDPDRIAGQIGPFVAAGARHILLWPMPSWSVRSMIDDLELFAAEVIPRVRSAQTNRSAR